MIHTNTKAIAKFFDEFIEGNHHCCANAATEAWTKILVENDRFQELITTLVYRTCEQEMDQKAILTFSERYATLVIKLIIASLAIGTTAGISTVYTAASEADVNLMFEKIIGQIIKTDALKSALKSAVFMKLGPEGSV